MEINDIPVKKRQGRKIARVVRHNLRVDMTPMVDLGFILITFFVVTVQLSKPVAMKLIMPKEGGEPTLVGESDALTLLLGKNDRVWYYEGDWSKASMENGLRETSFSEKDGIGRLIREKQQRLDASGRAEGRNGLMLLIKPGPEATYKNTIDALDETTIHAVKKYTILSPSASETAWINAQ